MKYDEAVEIINSKIFCKKEPNFVAIKKVLEKFDNPQNKLKYVHIAGTNGKGTTSTYVASVLQEANYKVALFTSPFIMKFTERFRINGAEISEEELIEEVTKIEDKIGNSIELSFFEYITVIAFNWFYKKNCDIVVLEVGLGGRADSTNVINESLVSAICSIGFDHTEMLGTTLKEIAHEKAGIIKENSELVLYPNLKEEALLEITDVAKKMNAKISVANNDIEILSEGINYSNICINSLNLEIPFTGYHQILNASTALKIIEKLTEKGFKIDEKAIFNGIKRAKLNGRIETLCLNPLIILDGGHNTDCANALKNTLNKHLENKKITAVIAMSSDKDYDGFLEILSPIFNKIITTKISNTHRALDEKILAKSAKKYSENVLSEMSLEKAIKIAINEKSDAVVICGSLYLVADATKIVKTLILKR